MKRQNAREYLKDLKQQMKINSKPQKQTKREPHKNTIAANEARKEKLDQLIDMFETFKMIFRQETPYGKEYLAEQKCRLKRRAKWQKKLGLA